MNDKKITVYQKFNYGKKSIYIKKPLKVKKAVKNLTGKKTVNKKDLKALKNLGFTIDQAIESKIEL